ncbi:MAG: nitroreductase [Micropepsaceae bacterium]
MTALIPAERLNTPAPDALKLLLTRRSGSAKAMTGPGPSPEQLDVILTAATRVPDHGKLTPWRFITFQGDARGRFGAELARLFREKNPDAIDEIVALEAKRFERAPVVVAVISRALGNAKVPEWEQVLSAGASCMALNLAAHALGFTASWLTEWPSYDERVKPLLGLADHERVAGFIYLGMPAAPLEDRPRPALETIVTAWR